MKPLQIKDVFLDDGTFHPTLTLSSRSLDQLKQDLVITKEYSFALVEWRADYVKEEEKTDGWLTNALKMIHEAFTEKPLIFTFRSNKEGGHSKVAERDLIELRKKAIDTGLIDLLDVELILLQEPTDHLLRKSYEDLISLAKKRGIKILLSYHDFKAREARPLLGNIFNTMVHYKADVGKIAVMVSNESQIRELAKASKEAAANLNIPHVLIGMGEMGLSTRFDQEKFASCLTYAALGHATAPGQLKIENLNQLFTKRKTTRTF